MIYWDKTNRRWKADINYRGLRVWLGNFEDRTGAEMALASFIDEDRAQSNRLCWWLARKFGGRPCDYYGACVAALREYTTAVCGWTVFRYVTKWVADGKPRVDNEYAMNVIENMKKWRGGYIYAYCFMGEKWTTARKRRGFPIYKTFQDDVEMLTRDNEAYIIGKKEVRE